MTECYGMKVLTPVMSHSKSYLYCLLLVVGWGSDKTDWKLLERDSCHRSSLPSDSSWSSRPLAPGNPYNYGKESSG